MEILTLEDVDKFFDKFEDPSLEVDRIVEVFGYFEIEFIKIKFTEERDEVRKYFVKKLIMKSYRLGKEHAYADSIATIRDR